jgi:hypothetical protein
MSNVKISELPVVSNNTFSTIYPQVQGGNTNQLAMSGFNTNDFVNVVNLGTGGTETVLTMDCNLGDVFVFTYTGTTAQTYTATTTNAIEGKTYYLVAQHKGATNSSFIIVDNSNWNDITNLTGANSNLRWTVNSFYVVNGKIICANGQNMTKVQGNYPY